MSPSTTMDTISALSKDYDSEVLKWADELREVRMFNHLCIVYTFTYT